MLLTGLLTLVLTNPIWVVKTRLCLQYEATSTSFKSEKYYSGMADALFKIYKYEGVRGWYKVQSQNAIYFVGLYLEEENKCCRLICWHTCNNFSFYWIWLTHECGKPSKCSIHVLIIQPKYFFYIHIATWNLIVILVYFQFHA